MHASTELVDSSILTNCHKLDEKALNVIDNLNRNNEGSVPTTLQVLSLIRPMITSFDVIDRIGVVNGYKKVLCSLLKNRGIEQRTSQWYEARGTMITASDFAQAVGQAKFGTEEEFYEKKCGYVEREFDQSAPPLRWGIMFEDVACELYSYLNGNVKVHNFGLLRHPTKPFIGASPDGITSDGIMVEIKCPWRRKINGSIPIQYYYQIQGQLEVCDLKECDYFECEFEQIYDIDNEYDQIISMYSESDLMFLIHNVGVVVEFIHKESKARTYKYPFNELHNIKSIYHIKSFLMNWVEHVINDVDRVIFDVQIVWWKVRKCDTLKISFDKAFTDALIKDLEVIWERIVTFKGNKTLYDEYMVNFNHRKTSKKNTHENNTPAYIKNMKDATPFSIDENED